MRHHLGPCESRLTPLLLGPTSRAQQAAKAALKALRAAEVTPRSFSRFSILPVIGRIGLSGRELPTESLEIAPLQAPHSWPWRDRVWQQSVFSLGRNNSLKNPNHKLRKKAASQIIGKMLQHFLRAYFVSSAKFDVKYSVLQESISGKSCRPSSWFTSLQPQHCCAADLFCYLNTPQTWSNSTRYFLVPSVWEC